MTEIFPWGSLGAISKKADLKLSHRFPINPPPEDGCCDVCGRHMSELKPFGGPGDPVAGDFTGEILVKTWRPMGPYNEEAEKAWEEAEKAVEETTESKDPRSWLIAKYGKEKGEMLSLAVEAYGCVGANWLCRDCIVLDEDDYFEKLNQRYREHGNE